MNEPPRWEYKPTAWDRLVQALGGALGVGLIVAGLMAAGYFVILFALFVNLRNLGSTK